MKTRIISLSLLIGLGLTSITFSSCRKKEEPQETTTTEDDEQSTANDNTTAENISADLDDIGSEISENGSLAAYKGASTEETGGLASSPCAVLSGLGTKTIIVNFGTTGCLGTDGRTRTGQLTFNFSASNPTTAVYYRNPGFAMQITSQNYVVDGYQVNIYNKYITNTTPATIPATVNPGTNLTWAITASISIVKPNNAGTIVWTCTRSKELMNTADTLCYRGQNRAINWKKAIVKLNGSASGVNARSENYTAIATNLIRDFNCSPDSQRPNRHPFIGGTIAYTPGNRFTRLINYGNGTACDLNATITVNNHVFNVVL